MYGQWFWFALIGTKIRSMSKIELPPMIFAEVVHRLTRE